MWIMIMRIMMLCMHNTFRIKILKSDNKYDDGKKDMMIWLSENDFKNLEDYNNGKKDNDDHWLSGSKMPDSR